MAEIVVADDVTVSEGRVRVLGMSGAAASAEYAARHADPTLALGLESEIAEALLIAKGSLCGNKG
jgi:hypothetical protein